MTIWQRQTANKLGKPVSQHWATKIISHNQIIRSLGYGLVGLVLALIAVLETPASFLGISSSMALLTIASGSWLTWTSWREDELTIRLFRDAIMAVRNGRSVIMRWDDVTRLNMRLSSNGQGMATTWLYQLQDVAGQKLTVTFSEGKRNRLGQTIQQEISERLLPQTLMALEAGLSVPFGSVRLSQHGLSYQQCHLAWTEIADVLMTNRHLVVIKRQGEIWVQVALWEVPNPSVCVATAQRQIKS
ncbi:MAG: DUF6585 family protein [Chloroflexota bacterium]